MECTVTILGSNAALPAFGRHPSSQVLTVGSRLFMIDCGEGTQMRLSDFGIKRSRIECIFISHLHGDHVFGLPGLITSFILHNRKDPLTIYGPAPLKAMMLHILESAQANLNFPLEFVELPIGHSQVYSNAQLEVEAFPLDHRMPTLGYKFTMSRRIQKVDKAAKEALGLGHEAIVCLVAGQNWITADGRTISPDRVCYWQETRKSYAYCSDTRYFPDLVPYIRGVDLLYHESTYGDDLAEQAHSRFHSTAREAAGIAAAAGVGQLMLGHYSSRYRDLDMLLGEAQSVFPATFLSREGEVYAIENQPGIDVPG